jgi:enoyl-CoA hydratase/carnithine racemase
VGPAAEFLLTARIMDAADAMRLGIVNLTTTVEDFERETGAYIASIAGNAPLTLKAVKRALVELSRPEADRDAAAVAALVKDCFTSEDYREGQAAFKEKREPVFHGK